MTNPEPPARKPPPNKWYKIDAIKLLQSTFKQMSVAAINCSFQYCQHNFTHTYRFLKNVDQHRRKQLQQSSGDDDEEEHPLSLMDEDAKKIFRPCFDKLKFKIFIVSDRQVKQRQEFYMPINIKLIKEIEEELPKFHNELEKEIEKLKSTKKAPPPPKPKPSRSSYLSSECQIVKVVKGKEPSIECGCCFHDIPFDGDELCQCNEGHLFCLGCVRNHVHEQVFGSVNYVVKCMSLDGDGCKALFPRSALQRALPDVKTFRTIEDHLSRANVEKANVKDL